MKGCHNCEHTEKQYPSWEECPCSQCKDPMFAEDTVPYDDVQHEELYADHNYPGNEKTPQLIKDWLRVVSTCVFGLVDLYRNHPYTFNICMERLHNPSKSYQEIAKRFGCTKQNVDYHLKQGCYYLPHLRAAFLVDPRFNRQTMANAEPN